MADVLMVDSGGSLTPVPADQLGDAAQLGWVPASPRQVADHALQARYGSTGQAVVAGAEGFAKGLTGGLSTVAERALGVDPEGIAGREQANPVAHGAGEIGGVAAGLLAPVARVASAPALIARAGSAVSRAAAPAAEAASLFGRLAAKAAATGAGSAVEGAFYGAGQVVHEAALGDPHLTAQSALATVGLSAALGGALGATGGLLAGAAKEFTPKDFGQRVARMLEESEAHSNFNATNAMPAAIKKTISGKGAGSTALGLEGRDLGIIKNPLIDSPAAILERAEAVKTAAGHEMDAIATRATRGEAITTWDALDGEVRKPLTKALRGSGSTVAVADQLESVLDRFAEAYQGRALGVSDVWTVRKDLGDFIWKNGKVIDPWAREVNAPLKRVYDHLDGVIERGIREAEGTEALTAWRKASRGFEVGSTFAKLAESGVERAAANNAVSLTGTIAAAAGFGAHGAAGAALVGAAGEAARKRGASALGWVARGAREALEGKTAEVIAATRQAGAPAVQATAVPEAVGALATLERQNAAIASRIDASVSTLVRGGTRAADIGRHEAEAGVASFFGRSREEAQGLHGRRIAEIGKLAQDPEQMHRALTGMADGIDAHAPNTAQAAQIAAARGVAFLASKIPANPPPGPLAKAPPPSSQDMATFARYYEAVQRPTDIIKQAASGTLTPEALEAVTVVYPQLLAKMRGAVIDKATSHRGAIPYASRLGMSALLGQDLDGSLKSTGRNQAVYSRANAAAAPAAPGGQAPSGAAHVTTGARTLTPSQASANRR